MLEGIALARTEAEAGADLIGVGGMGIGNTTASSAIVAAMTGEPPHRATGRGTGRTRGELQAKAEVVARALAVNRPDSTDLLGVLAGIILGGGAGSSERGPNAV